jgi:hypothetical protein
MPSLICPVCQRKKSVFSLEGTHNAMLIQSEQVIKYSQIALDTGTR